jgi:hypothetical protein
MTDQKKPRERSSQEPAETVRLASGASGFKADHPTDPEEGLKPLPPSPSSFLPAPKAPPTAPDLPPATPDLPPATPLRHSSPAVEPSLADLSAAGKRLARDISKNLPTFSSFEFSLNLADVLAVYWRERRDLLLLDEHGRPEQDYALVAERAHIVQDFGPTNAQESILDAVRRIADELDADKVGYYADSLKGPELRFVQAVHDLAAALLHYKLSARVGDRTDRLVMLTSSTGALGCIEAALGRFRGADLPDVISSYAQVLELKISAEAQRQG